MKIDMTGWGEFTVAGVFEIINGKGITTEEIEVNPGSLEAVQSGEANNGVIGLIDKAYCRSKGYSICEDACLTVARSGTAGYVSFHKNGCVAGDSAKILLLREKAARTAQAYLFLQTILSANRFKYTYGRKVTEALYGNTIIKLPVTSDSEPNWSWIKSHIESLHSRQLTTNNTNAARHLSLGAEGWKEYRVGDLFDSIYKVAPRDYDELRHGVSIEQGGIPYVTRTECDNGVKSLVSSAGLPCIEDGNAIVVGDTTATISYQPGPFVAGEHIIAARADWLNVYTGIFIVCLLRRERYRYSYGRAYKLESIRDTELLLPSTAEGSPDWHFMEEYIRTMPYGDRLQS